ncbi:MAG TPA: CHASE2 domain-containing protein, partial [Parvibaculum sp.]
MNSTPVFRRLSAILPGLVLVIGLALSIYDVAGLATSLQNQVFDAYQRIEPRKAGPANSHAVYVDIGAASVDAEGAWPWPRKRLSALIEAARSAGASAVVLDMPVDEPDPTSTSQLLKLWEPLGAEASTAGLQTGLANMPDYDRAFAADLAAAPSVISFVPGKAAIGDLRAPANAQAVLAEGSDARHYTRNYPAWRLSLPDFEIASKGEGATLPDRTPGTAVRGLPMVVNLNGTLYPSNVLEALRVTSNGTGYHVNVVEPASGFALGMEPGIDRVTLDGTDFAALTGPDGCLRLYFGRPETRLAIAASALMKNPADASLLRGRIAVIGVSSNGTERFYETPVGIPMASGAITANAIDQIVDGAYLTRPGWASAAEQLFIFLGGILVILAIGRFRFRWSFFLTIALVGGAGYGSWWAFDTHRWLIDPALGSITLI